MHFPPYVPVAKRREQAAKMAAKMAKQGKRLVPVVCSGRTIASTFWGKAWCEHLESFSDFENRLPRGRTYVRNGSVLHLAIEAGKIEALVQGSSLYNVAIGIKRVPEKKWRAMLASCSGQIDSAVELLEGRLSAATMKTFSHKKDGLFPQPGEMALDCSCPDWATMCKHVAAVLYGIGARLDREPELLFKLRHVDHLELVSQASFVAPSNASAKAMAGARAIAGQDLSVLFGIEIEAGARPAASEKTNAVRKAKKKSAKKKTQRKRHAAKQAR